MDKEVIQYLEGKNSSFEKMYNTFETIHKMLESGIIIIDSEEFNKDYFANILKEAKKYLPE